VDLTIPEELQLLARTVREYVERRLAPIERKVEDEDRIPDEIMQEMAALGFFGLPFPEEYGGAGAGDLGYCLALEQFGRTNAAYSNLIGAHTSIGTMSIYLGGSEEQKRRYVVPLARGEKLGAFSLTEPSSGSDAASLQTTATRANGHWVLNGTKIWVTNGPIADVVVVYAANDRAKGARGGISAFIVERGFKGFTVARVDEKMGLRGSYTATLVFEDCAVPEENVLGQIGFGFGIAMRALDIGRVSLAAGAVGTAQHLLELATAHARRRKQFGRAIGENQAVQWMLADSAVEIHAARLMVYDAAWKLDHGVRASREAAMVKVYASEMANRVADRVLQIHGGMGYMKELPIERAYRDARILRIYEGTSEIQRMIIAEDLLRAEG
jgi:acyl-CoA dehydrogenase